MVDLSFLAPDACVCFANTPDWCCCGDTERALRAYAEGYAMTALTPAQREACIEDAVYCEEGSSREEYEHLSDRDLARGVLAAYVTYCHDKGVL